MALAVSYRRPRSFSRHFITIQSNSPRTSPLNSLGPRPRFAAILGNSSAVESRVLGRGGSSSRITRRTSKSAASFTRFLVNGVEPVNSS